MNASDYYQLINQLRLQRGWTWQELTDFLDREGDLPSPRSVSQYDSLASRFSDDSEIIDAELADPPGPGVNPSAVAVDLVHGLEEVRADVYRPYYDETDERGHPVNFCPFSGIRLQRTCSGCGASLPRNLELHARFCASCGETLPLSVSLSDIQMNNYWVIFRNDRSPHQLKRFFSFPSTHIVRRILSCGEAVLQPSRADSERVPIRIVWYGAHRVQPLAAA